MDVSVAQRAITPFTNHWHAPGKLLSRATYCLALAAACSAGSVVRASTTITWNFAIDSGLLATTQSYTGAITKGPPPTGNPNLAITATGYESEKQAKKKIQISPTDLYGETRTASVKGLGVNAGTLPYPPPGSYQTNNELFTYTATVSKITTTFDGFLQLDLTSLIQLASQAGTPDSATITIAGTSNADVAAIAYSGVAGNVGTRIQTIAAPGAGGTSTVGFSLTNFTLKKHFLTITASKGQILVNAITLTIPSPQSVVPVPATLSLVLAGTGAMGVMLLARRRKVLRCCSLDPQ
jgi:hypothetical protein